MLKIFESTIDDVLPQDRCRYVPDAEHGFKLDCDHESIVHELREALRRERSANKALRRVAGLSNNEAKELASKELRRDAHVQASHSGTGVTTVALAHDDASDGSDSGTLVSGLSSAANNSRTDVIRELGEHGQDAGRLVG
jgi:2-phospho-L-lactate transferase/gluconeogenesis factor (CofD/UPF0052 family)